MSKKKTMRKSSKEALRVYLDDMDRHRNLKLWIRKSFDYIFVLVIPTKTASESSRKILQTIAQNITEKLLTLTY